MVSTEDEVGEEYEKALADLNCNSKPLINMLTMLADENRRFAAKVVQMIEMRIKQVSNDQKLPILYLIDSIVKNCEDSLYKDYFAKNLIDTFVHVFDKGDEKTRQALFKLRQTWTNVFPASRLYGIDIKVHAIDPKWPLVDPSKILSTSSAAAASKPSTSSIHVNPKFLSQQQAAAAALEVAKKESFPVNQVKLEPTVDKTVDAPKKLNLNNNSSAVVKPASTVSNASRDPRIRNASDRRVVPPSSVVDGFPSIPSSSTFDAALNSNNNTRKVVVEKKSLTTQRPVSVVAKVSPKVVAEVEAGRWTFQQRENNNSIGEYKIGKVKRSNEFVDEKQRDNLDGGNKQQRDNVDGGNKQQRNNVDGSNKQQRDNVDGGNIVNGRGFRGRGGRGGGGGRGNFGDRTTSLTNNNGGTKKFSSPQNKSYTDSSFEEEPKRRRSRSPSEESAKVKSSKRSDQQAVFAKNSRRDEKDYDERELVPRKKTKESTTTREKDVARGGGVSNAARLADLDLRNNSTDSDRSGRDVDLRTLPFKKRKRSDDISVPIDEYPLDQVLPKEVSSAETSKAKKRLKSGDDIDELLFGSNEDHDMRFVKQRKNNQQAISPRSKDGKMFEREKRPPKMVNVDMSTSAMALKEVKTYRNRVYEDQHDDMRVIGGAKKFNAAPMRPKMAPIPKKLPSAVRPMGGANNTPVFQNSSGRQPLLRAAAPPPTVQIAPPAVVDGPPAPNNRIFVDGCSYEVMYVDEVAVIERNGYPHRVSFIGGGRDVVIDGIAYPLKFDEIKEIFVDGHLHKIRFGGPSRELYMGNYPFRGSFGGPPIFATINGVKHKIQLCGPQPEVKIDPEPYYELMRRYDPPPQSQILAKPYEAVVPYDANPNPFYNQPPPPMRPPVVPVVLPFPAQIPIVLPANQPPVVAPPTGVMDLMNQLLKTGLLSNTAADDRQVPPAAPVRVDSVDGSVKRSREPPSSLRDFNVPALKIRYSAVVDGLHRDRIQCSTCGMRFIDCDQAKYSKHLDWHFKQNRLEKFPGRSTSRSWYFAADDWVNFEEFVDENAPKARSTVFESAAAQTQIEQTNRLLITSTDSVIIATNDDQNECAVCHESFEQFWDEDEEAWKLRNAMLVGEKAYHPLCYQDASNVDHDLPSTGFASPSTSPVTWTYVGGTKVEEMDEEGKNEEEKQRDDVSSEEVKRNMSSQDLLTTLLQSVVATTSMSVNLLTNIVCTSPSSSSFSSFDVNSSTVCTSTAPSTSTVDILLTNDVNSKSVSSSVDDDKRCREVANRGEQQEETSSGGTTPLRDEREDGSPGTPVHDESSLF